MKKTVTIALVNFNTKNLLFKCIKSIYRHTKRVSFEIVVVDNASADGSLQMVEDNFPKMKTIENKKNLYATRGNNQILDFAKGEYFMVLNPDIEFFADAISKMVLFLENNHDFVAVSCRQVMADGKADGTCSRFSNPIVEFFSACIIARIIKNPKLMSWYKYGTWNRKTFKKVDVIPDTIMLIRTNLFKQLGGYDENIDLFFMENDLCMQIKKAGFSVAHLGFITVKHLRGQSTKLFLAREMYKIYERDMLYYYKKYFGIGWYTFLKIAFLSNRFYYVVEPAIDFLRTKRRVNV